MLKRSIIEGVRFNYLLVDSWFSCTEFLKFVVSRHFKCHLIGMIKMGKTKYEATLETKTAPELIKALQKSKSVSTAVPSVITLRLSQRSFLVSRLTYSSIKKVKTAIGMLC